jgi:hypothetical protein
MKYKKYPRTYHFSFSPGKTSDDKVIKDNKIFDEKEVIITEKMDGENTTLYDDAFHARSLDSKGGAHRSWLASFRSSICNDIPSDIRICGENLFAKHSISYDSLKSYFYGFSVYNGDTCLSWKDTVEYFDLLGIQSVPVIYQGIWDLKNFQELIIKTDFSKVEGYVVRLASSFSISDFDKSVAKYVRANHVTTSDHWLKQAIVKNGLISV